MAAVTRDGDGCVPLAELDINPALRATCQRRLAAALEGRAMTARKLAEFSGVSEAGHLEDGSTASARPRSTRSCASR